VRTKPAIVAAAVASVKRGGWDAGAAGAGGVLVFRSVAKKRRMMRYSTPIATSHGPVIRAAKRVKVSPAAAKASRFVRFDTGSNTDPVLDRWAQA
jgi:hypothetical protein